MGKEIPLETRFRAEELYVVDGLTYDQVGEATDVSVSQLKRWGSESDWVERKREYREALSSIRRDTVLLRQKLLTEAMNSLDPQAVYAVARMEVVAAKVRENNTEDASGDIDRPKLFLEDMEFIAGVLKEIDPEGLKVFGKNFDVIVKRFKESHAQTA